MMPRKPSKAYAFIKMHAFGNDFMILPECTAPCTEHIQAWADRHRGIGFDQLLSYETHQDNILAVRIFNADGTQAEQCGNGLRCVARLWLDRHPEHDNVMLRTQRAEHHAERHPLGIRINMGIPILRCGAVGLKHHNVHANTVLHLHDRPYAVTAVSMGNPHLIHFCRDELPKNWRTEGEALSQHPDCPEGANVSFVLLRDAGNLDCFTVERGAGPTQSCGSAACASAAAAMHEKACQRNMQVVQPGGILHVNWPEDNMACWLIGEAAYSFQGEVHG
jgi:diaminopimelate epimerase